MKHVLVAAILAMGVTVMVGQAVGQKENPSGAPHFSDPERVARCFDNTPFQAVRTLEGILAQEQIDALEQALFPKPSDAQTKGVYLRIQTELKRLGLEPDDALLQAVSSRIAGLDDVTTGGK